MTYGVRSCLFTITYALFSMREASRVAIFRGKLFVSLRDVRIGRVWPISKAATSPSVQRHRPDPSRVPSQWHFAPFVGSMRRFGRYTAASASAASGIRPLRVPSNGAPKRSDSVLTAGILARFCRGSAAVLPPILATWAYCYSWRRPGRGRPEDRQYDDWLDDGRGWPLRWPKHDRQRMAYGCPRL